MARHIEVSLDKRGVRCVARLLDELAPRTCAAIWDALPQSGQAYHAKYARNEIYALVPAFADPEPGRENTTITPIPENIVGYRRKSYAVWEITLACNLACGHCGSRAGDARENELSTDEAVDLVRQLAREAHAK